MTDYTGSWIRSKTGRQWQLKSFLDSGGQGQIYITDSDKYVAKILNKEISRQWLQRTNQYVIQPKLWQMTKSLESLPREIFEIDGTIGYVTKRAPGKSLLRLLEEGEISGSSKQLELLNIALRLSEGVKCLHRNKVIVADLCEANLIISLRRSSCRIIDIDGLGISELYSPLVVRPAGALPIELTLGQTFSDQQSDLWQLAILLHKLLVGSHPFPYPNVKKLSDIVQTRPAIEYPVTDKQRLKLRFLGNEVRNLFVRVFGSLRLRVVKNPPDRSNRPSAEIWEDILRVAISRVKICANCGEEFVQNLPARHTPLCPNCSPIQ